MSNGKQLFYNQFSMPQSPKNKLFWVLKVFKNYKLLQNAFIEHSQSIYFLKGNIMEHIIVADLVQHYIYHFVYVASKVKKKL